MKVKNMVPAVIGAIVKDGVEGVEIKITFDSEGNMIVKVSPKSEEG